MSTLPNLILTLPKPSLITSPDISEGLPWLNHILRITMGKTSLFGTTAMKMNNVRTKPSLLLNSSKGLSFTFMKSISTRCAITVSMRKSISLPIGLFSFFQDILRKPASCAEIGLSESNYPLAMIPLDALVETIWNFSAFSGLVMLPLCPLDVYNGAIGGTAK